MIFQNLWIATKVVLREKVISANVYIKKGQSSQINNLTFHLKKLDIKKQSNSNQANRK